MKMSPGFANIAQSFFDMRKAVADVQLVKDAQGDKARYIRHGTLLASIEPVMYAHGWMIVQGDDGHRADADVIYIETTLMHMSGEWVSTTVPIPLVGAMVSEKNNPKAFEVLRGYRPLDPQAGGIGISYGRRYGVFAILSLAIDEDNDGARKTRKRRDDAARPVDGAASEGRSARSTEWFEAGIMPLGNYAGVKMAVLKVERLRAVMAKANKQQKFEEARAISHELNRRANDPTWTEPESEPDAPNQVSAEPSNGTA